MRSLVATVLCVALTLGSCPSLCASEDNEWKELIEFIGYFAADKLAPGLAAKHSKKLGKVFGTANVSDIKRAVDIVDKGCNNDFKGVRDELAKEGIERIIEYCYPKSFQGPMTLYMSLVDAWIITVQSGIDRWKGDLWNHPSCGAVGALMMKEAGQMAHRGQLYWHSAACEKSDEMGHLVNKMKAVEDKLFKLWESDGHADGLMGDRFLNPLIWHAGGKPQKDRDYFDFFLRGEFERLKERVLFQYESACIRSKMKAARANILRQAKSAGLLKSSIAQSSPSSTTKPITRKPQKPAEWKGKAVYVDEQYTPKPLNLDTFNSIESEIIKAHLRQTWQERLDILEDFDKKMWPFYTLLREGVKEAESFYYNVSQGKALSVPSKEYKRRKEIEKMGSRGRSGVLAQITPAKHKLNGTKIGTKLPGTSYMPPLHRQKIIAETMANFGLPTDYSSTNRVFKGLCKTDKYYCYQPLIDYMKNLKDFCWRTRGLVDLALSDPKNMYEKLPEAEAYWRKAAMARKRFLAHGPLFKGRLPANLHEMGEPFDLMGSGEHGPVNDLVSKPSSQAYAAKNQETTEREKPKAIYEAFQGDAITRLLTSPRPWNNAQVQHLIRNCNADEARMTPKVSNIDSWGRYAGGAYHVSGPPLDYHGFESPFHYQWIKRPIVRAYVERRLRGLPVGPDFFGIKVSPIVRQGPMHYGQQPALQIVPGTVGALYRRCIAGVVLPRIPANDFWILTEDSWSVAPGRYEEVIGRYGAYLQRNANDLIALCLLSKAHAELGMKKRHDILWHTDVTLQKLGNEEFRLAINYAERASKLAPNDPEVLRRLARAYFYARKYKQANRAMGKLVKLEPQNALNYYLRAYLCWGRRMQGFGIPAIKGTIRNSDLTIKYAPDFARGHVLRAAANAWINRARAGYNAAKKGAEIAPNDAWALSMLGDLARIRRRWQEAERAYTQAINLRPNGVWSYDYRAICRQKLGNRKGAAEDLEQALRCVPGKHRKERQHRREIKRALKRNSRW